MTFVLPYPNSPQNGDAGNADPVRLNTQALAQAIQSFDGSQIQAATILEAALASAINPRLRASEMFSNFVYTGCAWSSVSGLNGTMTGGTIYVNGYRTPVNSIGSKTFTASQDTYVAIDYLGNVTYWPVGNGAASPTLPTNSMWVAKVVTNGSAITSVVQSGWDSVGNPIYNTSPTPMTLGYAQITSAFTSTVINAYTDVTSLSVPVIIPAGVKRAKVTVGGQYMSTSAAAGTNVELVATDVTAGAVVGGVLVNNFGGFYAMNPNFVASNIPVTAGARTFKVQFQANVAGTFKLNATSTEPAFILVEPM